jgi:hypothetical protein
MRPLFFSLHFLILLMLYSIYSLSHQKANDKVRSRFIIVDYDLLHNKRQSKPASSLHEKRPAISFDQFIHLLMKDMGV